MAISGWLSKILKSLSTIEYPEGVLFVHLYLNIEEFDSMDVEDIKDALGYIFEIIDNSTISVGIKIYGTDIKGEIVKEALVLT